MKIEFKKIELNKTNYNPKIVVGKKYAVRQGHQLYHGEFREQWYGLVFQRYPDKYMQLNFLEEVYECVDISSQEKKTRERSINRNLVKVLKSPVIIDVDIEGDGSISVVSIMNNWNKGKFKYHIFLADIEKFVANDKKRRYSFSMSKCYISNKRD
jgi:hypothetical protein